MKRLISITALATALLVSLSLQAQMRGGGGGRGFGGGGRSFGGGARVSSGFRSGAPMGGRGFVSAPRGFAPAGPRVFAPRVFAPSGRSFASGSFGVRTFAPTHRTFVPFPHHGFNHFHNVGFRFHHFHNRFFFPGCFGCVSPFFFGGGFFLGDPFFSGYPYYSAFGPDYYGYAPPPQQPVVVSTDNGGNMQLAAEVARLSDAVDDLRYEQSRSRAESRPETAPNTSITASEPATAVSFVFRDGRRITAKNYAIAGQTLWILNEHVARKFSLSELDAPATQQANAVNGVEIHIPGAEKQ